MYNIVYLHAYLTTISSFFQAYSYSSLLTSGLVSTFKTRVQYDSSFCMVKQYTT